MKNLECNGCEKVIDQDSKDFFPYFDEGLCKTCEDEAYEIKLIDGELTEEEINERNLVLQARDAALANLALPAVQ